MTDSQLARGYDVVIVGAGFAGLYALFKLRQMDPRAEVAPC